VFESTFDIAKTLGNSRMRLQCGLLLGLVLLVGCTEQAGTEKGNEEEVYFLREVVTVEGDTPTSVMQSSFSAVRLSRHEDGTQTLRQRTLWWRQTGGDEDLSKRGMDPERAEDQSLLALLASGFDLRFDKHGEAKNLRPVDKQAAAAVAQHRPDATAMVATRELNAGLRPVVLPDLPSVGQEFTRTEQSDRFGVLSSHMRVAELTDEVALVDMTVTGEGVSGGGQQVVRRRDGMPIEVQFELVRKATAERPATTMQRIVNNMAHPPAMELGADAARYRLNRDNAAESLARPPFSVQTDDARLYYLVREKEGELSSWMLSAAALDSMEKDLMFALMGELHASRPLIVMGGKMSLASSAGVAPGQSSPFVLAELRKVTLLDAAGRELPDLIPMPVYRKLMFTDHFQVMEKDIEFPFRLPLDTRAIQLAGLETIRLDMGVETYTWVGTETVKAGAQPKDNPGARITWTGPRRLTMEQDRTPSDVRTGMWTVAVPVDAQGRQIPSSVLDTGAYIEEKDPQHPQPVPPLDWSHRKLPLRQEIATLQPAAALQLRHYRWQQVPRQWTLRNARNVTPLGGQR
jgi:hypothetical protein